MSNSLREEWAEVCAERDKLRVQLDEAKEYAEFLGGMELTGEGAKMLNEAVEARAAAAEGALREARAAKDGAYAERNQCVALLVRMALALGWRAGVRDHEDKPGETWEPDWRSLVCIDLPTGQVSWHFHDSEKHLLAGLPEYPASWDGHDTPEKYRRANAALARKAER